MKSKITKQPTPPIDDADQKPLRFIYKAELLDRVGMSYPQIWAWMRDGRFPMSRSVAGKVAWIEREIDDWMMSRPHRQYKPADDLMEKPARKGA
jgi:predicted DNA-binding transcriptional regulator AlpA